jgi:hypothetical protein
MQRATFYQCLAGAAALALLAASQVTAQNPAAAKQGAAKSGAAKKGGIVRTAWGDPDLNGTWFVMFDVPLERSAANAGKEFLSDAEVQAADEKKGINPGRNARAAGADDVSGAYNAVFNSILKTGKRTSMIIDPKDGRIPPLVPGVRAPAPPRVTLNAAGTPTEVPGINDNPETVAQNPRCLGVPMPFLPLNTAFAQGTVMQVVQSPKSLGIYMEDDHAGGGNRVIHMDGKHPAPSARFYLGDSRGHWEGSTLVVETTNFTTGFRGSNPDTYKMTERITRTGPNDLKREITFEDPKTWARPWTVEILMGKSDDKKHMIFDSACHEGNYGLIGILSGARRDEQAAQAAKKQQ